MSSKTTQAFALILLFALLIRPVYSGREPAVGTVTVISGGRTYAPLENWIYSHHDGLAADGWRKQPEEVTEELTAIPVEDDFRIVIDGKPLNKPYYTLYNSEFEQDAYGTARFSAPRDQGDYILFVEVVWGHDENSVGYQYCFKLTV